MATEPHLRDVDYVDLKTGKGLRFTLVIPLPSGEVFLVPGYLARRTAKGKLEVLPPSRKAGHRYFPMVETPMGLLLEMADLLEMQYGKKLYYKPPKGRKAPGRKRVPRYAPSATPEEIAMVETPPWGE